LLFFLFRCDQENSQISLPILEFYTKSNCELCDKALQKLAPILKNVNLQKVDISLKDNEKYFNLYRFEIPVIKLETKSENLIMRNREIDIDILRDCIEKNSK